MGCTVQSMLRSGRSVRILGCEVHSRGRTPHGVRGLKYVMWCEAISALRRTPHGVRGLKSTVNSPLTGRTKSHPSRGAWIEISYSRKNRPNFDGRTPHGVRGLKYLLADARVLRARSHPSRGAWIEIKISYGSMRDASRRTPHGVRGLKSRRCLRLFVESSRTPHGVRGLKYRRPDSAPHRPVVAPLTGCVD